MAVKLGRKELPSGHSREDFECFGPPAVKDGEFDNCMIADLGCFNQALVDSNKGYHASVVKSKKNGKWYTYFEWGRTGGSPDFLFQECYSKEEAQQLFAKQLHSKNDKRGEWVTIAGRQVLRAKEGEDCYLVRPSARRTTGLPDAQKIVHDDSNLNLNSTTPIKTSKSKKINKPTRDEKTLELGRALTGATLNYTRKSMAGSHIPTQSAIDEGRDILIEALTRVQKVGNDTQAQINDNELKQLTSILYGRIPKIKVVGAPESTWILSSQNIQAWQMDLDAFESALFSLKSETKDVQHVNDPFEGFDLDIWWLDPKSPQGEFISNWAPKASANRHGGIGNMHIENMWVFSQKNLINTFSSTVEKIAKEVNSKRNETPLFQPKTRLDLEEDKRRKFNEAHVSQLFHGTRAQNVNSILRIGLKVPGQVKGVAINGALLGSSGLYFADDWKKSAGYCSLSGSYWVRGEGAVKSRGAFMFITNVCLGNPHTADRGYGYVSPPKGCHSVLGKAHYTSLGYSSLQNNEWVVYTPNQVNLNYLIEFSAK